MKIIVIGSKGMLGRDLMPRLKAKGLNVRGFDIDELDITRSDKILPCFVPFDPDVVINCAAYTAVDKAESEPELAFAVNSEGPANLANACKELNIPFIHISTDYVFDGNGEKPYCEDDPVNPLGVYGQSKWGGEEAVRSRLKEHLIVRTSWLYGVHGNNFVKTILRLCREKEELSVVADQKGCPTWTGDLSDALVELIDRIKNRSVSMPWGTYHFCGSGSTSWYEFALAIVEEARKRETFGLLRILPITTSEYPTPAKRPMRSVMDCRKIQETFDIHPKQWEKSLGHFWRRP